MKTTHKSLLITLSIIVMLICLLFYQNYKQQAVNNTYSNDAPKANGNENENNNRSNQAVNDKNVDKRKLINGIDKFAQTISRQICEHEQKVLLDATDAQNSGKKLSAAQLTEMLKKSSNSKCSSFRKSNAEWLFSKFELDKNNYKSFFNEFELVLKEYRGLAPYKLISASIKELDHAALNEIGPLKEAIIFSVKNQINDSSAIVDLAGSMATLKEVRDRDLILHPTVAQIQAIQEEFNQWTQGHIRKSQAAHKPLPPGLSVDELADFLGYEGAKTELQLMREEYETVLQFGNRLNDLLGKNFQ